MNIAIECDNLNLANGTGIATYAASLTSALRTLGHAPVAVCGVKDRLVSTNDLLTEVQLYDARLTLERPVLDFLRRARYWVHGAPRGARAQRIPQMGQVHISSSSHPLRDFGSVYAVPHLSLRAEMHFNRFGTLMTLKGVNNVAAFHTTQPIALSVRGIPNLYTLHDVIPLRLPYATLDNKQGYFDLLSRIIRNAHKIVTVSEFSRQDILSIFKCSEDRVVNTYQSVTLPPRLLMMSEDDVSNHIANCFGLEYKKYYLFIGAIEPKKNIKRLIDGYAASGSENPLVLAGSLGWQYDNDVRAIGDERFLRYRMKGGMIRPERSVRHLNYVTRQDLVLLLRGARALVFPSLYEGFGLPVLEAMLAGTPVITSDISSLPEVAGEAAEYVNPLEADSIARAIRTLDQDDERCAELRTLGLKRAEFFSPARYQQRLAEVYDGIR